MINGAASLVYLGLFLLALIPVGIYCHLTEKHYNESENNND